MRSAGGGSSYKRFFAGGKLFSAPRTFPRTSAFSFRDCLWMIGRTLLPDLVRDAGGSWVLLERFWRVRNCFSGPPPPRTPAHPTVRSSLPSRSHSHHATSAGGI